MNNNSENVPAFEENKEVQSLRNGEEPKLQIKVDPFHVSVLCLSLPRACAESHGITKDAAASSPGVT